VSVVPNSDLDHLLKALKTDAHVITTATPKKYPRGPMKVFPVKTTRDGAKSAMDQKSRPLDIKRSQSSSQLTNGGKKGPENKPPVRRINSASSVKPLTPKSPKRERKPTNGSTKEKGEYTNKKPKISMPLIYYPRSSTPEEDQMRPATDISSVLTSQQNVGKHSSEELSLSHSSSPERSTSVPNTCTETSSQLESNVMEEGFMQTDTPDSTSSTSVDSSPSLSLVSRSTPSQNTSCAVEHRMIDLRQPQVLLANTNTNNSGISIATSPTPVSHTPTMDSTSQGQVKGRVPQIPPMLETGLGGKHTNYHRLGGPQPPSSPVSEDAFSTDSGHVPSNGLSSGQSTPTYIYSPVPTMQCDTSSRDTTFNESSHNLSLTRILSESHYDELNDLPHEELLSTFKKMYMKNKEQLSE
jgi:hypothetical protein